MGYSSTKHYLWAMDCRYVMVLDVSSLKPDAESLEASVDYEPNLSFQDINIGVGSQFDLETKKVATLSQILAHWRPHNPSNATRLDGVRTMLFADAGTGSNVNRRGQGQIHEKGRGSSRGRGQNIHVFKGKKKIEAVTSGSIASIGTVRRSSRKVVSRGTDPDTKDCEVLNSEIVVKAEFVGELGMSSRENITGMGSEKQVSLPNDVTDGGASLGSNDAVAGEPSEQTRSKRRGDAEFELELARALAATAAAAAAVEGGNEPIEVSENGTRSVRSLEQEPRSKSVLKEGRGGGNAAIWSRKMGPLLHWAEVYCGEGDTGR
jgi:hypothetical protein